MNVKRKILGLIAMAATVMAVLLWPAQVAVAAGVWLPDRREGCANGWPGCCSRKARGAAQYSCMGRPEQRRGCGDLDGRLRTKRRTLSSAQRCAYTQPIRAG